MKSRIRTHKKRTKEQKQEFSTAPAQGMFQSRPFVVQTQQAQQSQQPDLKTALQRAERYGHNLSRLHLAGVPAPIDNDGRERRSPILQQKSREAGRAGVPDMEASIREVMGGGKSHEENIRKPIEQGRGIVQRVVIPTRQPTSNVCWATVGYAIHKHKGGAYTSIREFVKDLGSNDALAKYDKDQPTDIDKIIGSQSQQNWLQGSDSEGKYGKNGITNKLMTKGEPIVANVNNNHYIILTSRQIDKGTYKLTYMDPASGTMETADAHEDPNNKAMITGVGQYSLSVLYYTS